MNMCYFKGTEIHSAYGGLAALLIKFVYILSKENIYNRHKDESIQIRTQANYAYLKLPNT